MIFIVDSAEDFHKENFKRNYSHYSGLSKRFPLGVTYNFVQRTGSRIYFNPLIPMKTLGEKDDLRKLKYGVI